MTMQLGDVEGGTGPRRRWAAGLAAAMLVAAAGGIGFGIGYAIGDDGSDRIAGPTDEGTAGAPTTDPPATAGTERVPSESVSTAGAEPASTEPVPTEVDPSDDVGAVEATLESESGSWYEYGPGSGTLAPMESVYRRTTDAGLTLRLQRGERWGPSPGELGTSGWVPPGWCQPAAQSRVTLVGDEVVDVAWTSSFDEHFGGRTVQLMTMGSADGVPHWVLVVETDLRAGIDTVAVRFPDGAGDSTPLVDGMALLAVPRSASDVEPDFYPFGVEYELVFSGDGGEETVSSDDLGQWNDAAFQASCTPPPPELPPPGEQPADAAVAEAEIRAAMDALYGGELDDGSIFLDDATGVAEARQQVREGGFEAEAASAEAIIEELVFTAPDEAWFRYRIETSGIDLPDRFGVALVVDGTWRITRGTVCQDLAMAGGDCGDWQPIILPTG